MAIATFLARYTGHTKQNYTTDLKHYMRFCRSNGLGMLTVERGHLEIYIREMELAGYAESTIARRFGTVYSMLEYAEIDDRIPKNPARKVARPKVHSDRQKRPFFTLAEAISIINRARHNVTVLDARAEQLAHAVTAVDRRRYEQTLRMRRSAVQDFTLLHLMFDTGMRVGEVCSLDVESLHVGHGGAWLNYIRKGGNLTRIDLPADVLMSVVRHNEISGRKTGPLFVTRTGQRIHRSNVQWVITRVARQVGITRHVPPHGVRRAHAVAAEQLGASESELQGSLQHVDPRTTQIYRVGRKKGSVARMLVAEALAT
ncbi:MAG TPA: tyrosine-type recombinase/integrase [Mycobacteriales bacterium]|nr:tyrosine-type recombinase/integrase [Mycobacteriales bacterium]